MNFAPYETLASALLRMRLEIRATHPTTLRICCGFGEMFERSATLKTVTGTF